MRLQGDLWAKQEVYQPQMVLWRTTGVTLEEGTVNFVVVLNQGDCIRNAGPQFTHSQKSERLHMTRHPCQELAEYFRRQLVAHYESYQFGTFFAMLRPPLPR